MKQTAEYKTNKTDKEATQEFAIRTVITNFCGPDLSANMVNKLCSAINKEMQTGSCAWAFK